MFAPADLEPSTGAVTIEKLGAATTAIHPTGPRAGHAHYASDPSHQVTPIRGTSTRPDLKAAG